MDIKVGADPFPPYQYLDEQGVIQGSDYEIIEKTLTKMGMKATYILDDWSKIEEMLINKEIDVAFQVQKTPERESKYLFSSIFRNAITSIISLESLKVNIRSINEIPSMGMKIALISGYKYGEIIDRLPETSKVYCKDQIDQINSVFTNKADYAVVDLGVFKWQAKQNNFEGIKILENLGFNRPLFVVFNEPCLRDKFNATIGGD